MVPRPMRRTTSIAAAVTAALTLAPPAAGAAVPDHVLAAAVPLADAPAALVADVALPRAVLAAATPLAATPLREEGRPLTRTPPTREGAERSAPRADNEPVTLADASDAEALLARAPAATSRPPAATLPHTGNELWLTFLAGAGMAMAGAGLRLRLDATAPARS